MSPLTCHQGTNEINRILIPPMFAQHDLSEKVAADAQKIVVTLEKKLTEGAVLSDKDLKTLEKARADYEKNKNGTSLVGLDAPLFPLKNPGIVSMPIGFLVTIVATLLFRNKREEKMFEELFVRQTTCYGVAKAAKH